MDEMVNRIPDQILTFANQIFLSPIICNLQNIEETLHEIFPNCEELFHEHFLSQQGVGKHIRGLWTNLRARKPSR